MSRRIPGLRRHDFRGLELIVLLVIAMAVPSASVLWFMNEAVSSEAILSRSMLTEAYRGQLRLMRGRLHTYWQTRVADIESNLPEPAAAAFAHLVKRGVADTVVVFDRSGSQYPTLTPPAAGAASGGSALARSIQEAVRDMVQQGRAPAAVKVIRESFFAGPASRGVDPDGRLIAADAQLLLINLLPVNDPRRPEAIGGLTALLNDYSSARLPAAQRVFLMEQLRPVVREPAEDRFPTLRAEQLALSFLEAESPDRGTTAIRQTGSRDLWQLRSPSGRVVALYTTGTVLTAMRSILEDHSADVAFQVIPPGATSDDDAVAIGSLLPGWEVSFKMVEPAPGARATAQRATYVAVALVAIGAAAVAIGLAGGAARRQVRLASLRTDLVSAVSHELKTPLASMRLLVDALLEEERLDEVKTREYLQLMSVENARLTRLIENFLTFSRLERKRQQFTFSPVDPAELAREAVKVMPERLRGESKPTLEIASGLPRIAADPDALLTVLLNLLDNAYKYTPAEQRISLSVARASDEVVFAVQDNGIGIAPRDVKRIFRRFYRVDQRLAGATAGSGLGLSIVDAIVRAHGGRVEVRSAPGRGSTFAVHLPCVREGVAA